MNIIYPLQRRFLLFFLLPLIAWWVFLGVILGNYGYVGSFLVMNSWHSPMLDQPMFLLGWLGDSLLLGSLMVLLHRKRPEEAISFIVVLVVTGLTAQFLKQIVFPAWDRPLRVVGDENLVHLVNNVRLMHNSFPSGHSVSAGAAFTLLAWFHKDRLIVLVISLVLAVIIPYTRIYTGAHFSGDVLAGSMLGSLLCLALLPVMTSHILKNPAFSGERKSTFTLSLTILSIVALIIFGFIQAFFA